MNYVIGVDEAGRGPLAGPVSIGVVRVPEGFNLLATFPGLNDSKKLTEKKREAIFTQLEIEKEKGNVEYRVLLTSAKDIDEKGISVCIREAVAKGVEEILPQPKEGKVWLDGSLSAPKQYTQETVIGGDGKVPAIMLASVAAKVVRDRVMVKYAKEYPEYGFEKHKGYGTAAHMKALREHEVCDIHRRTFIHLD